MPGKVLLYSAIAAGTIMAQGVAELQPRYGRVALREVARVAYRKVKIGDEFVCGLQEFAPGAGEFDAACGAIEQLQVQFAFEFADRKRERRLRQVGPFGGAGEGAKLGNRAESLDLAKCDIHNRSISIDKIMSSCSMNGSG